VDTLRRPDKPVVALSGNRKGLARLKCESRRHRPTTKRFESAPPTTWIDGQRLVSRRTSSKP